MDLIIYQFGATVTFLSMHGLFLNLEGILTCCGLSANLYFLRQVGKPGRMRYTDAFKLGELVIVRDKSKGGRGVAVRRSLHVLVQELP